MAFDQDNLAPLTTGLIKGPNIWSYSAGTDTLTNVKAANYFNSAHRLLKKGDLIVANLSSNGTLVDDDTYLLRVSNITSAGVVSVHNSLTAASAKIGS